MQVKQASFKDGLLIVDLIREIPGRDEAAAHPDRRMPALPAQIEQKAAWRHFGNEGSAQRITDRAHGL